MNFKPTFIKSLLSILVVVSNYIYVIISINNICPTASFICECQKGFSLVPDCCGCSIGLITLLNQIFNILLPGIILYVVYSLLEHLRLKSKPKNKKTKKRGRK
ncbi:hypothetical protein GOV12_01015 [Candidatus Pacearchaeota archaeon]|nr:hypothetical protein [Candidatus Pacearchaeota archaeon]